jgi:hypothetical protein
MILQTTWVKANRYAALVCHNLFEAFCVLEEAFEALRNRHIDAKRDEATPVGLPQSEPPARTRAERVLDFGLAVRLYHEIFIP